MYTYIVNDKVFKSYKEADKYAVGLRNDGISVSCRVECNNTSVRRYSQKIRVKNSRNTWDKKEYAGTGYGEELQRIVCKLDKGDTMENSVAGQSNCASPARKRIY